ncbi:MAG: hypothetical protein ACREQ5_33510, partial [Candidatus Dormibacteria bacterium]
MVEVPAPVPEDPSQLSGGVPVERCVTHIDFENELHSAILSRTPRWRRSSWLNRIEAQFTTLQYFTLSGT